MIRYLCLLILCVNSFVFCKKIVTPLELAKAEVGAWKAYYSGDKVGVLSHLRLLIHYQYQGISPRVLEDISGQFASAILAFKRSTPNEYDKIVLPLLVEAYGILKSVTHSTWSSIDVAKADLAWWIARRTKGYNEPSNVGQKIANLYTLIYGNQDNRHFLRAGYLRASSARYRDLCAHQYGGITDNDWLIIYHLLLDAYGELILGIQNNLNST